MKPLLDTLQVGQQVRGVATRIIYEVMHIDWEAVYRKEDAITLRNTLTQNEITYTPAQFNHHFRKVKTAKEK